MKKFFIILYGPMGGGKTTVAKILFKNLSRTAVVNWDELKWCITDFKPGDDTPMVLEVLEKILKTFMAYVLNIFLDGGFSRSERLTSFIRLAKQKKYKLFIYHFTA